MEYPIKRTLFFNSMCGEEGNPEFREINLVFCKNLLKNILEKGNLVSSHGFLYNYFIRMEEIMLFVEV
jgi:hypothetical protein